MVELGELVEVGSRYKVGQETPQSIYELVPYAGDYDDSILDVAVFSQESPIHTAELDLRIAHIVSEYLHRLSRSRFTAEQVSRLRFLGSNPTCREVIDYVSRKQPYFDFVVPVNNVDGYVLSGKSFHGLYAQRKVPVLDIHDVLLHTLQFEDMGETLTPVHNKFTQEAFDRNKNPELSVAFFALAEYTIVRSGSEIVSFGALNWQYFRKSHAAQHAETNDAIRKNDIKKALRWNSIRAVTSMFRRSLEIERPDLIQKLGYTLDERIIEKVEPYENLDLREIFSTDVDPESVVLEAPKRKKLEANVRCILNEVDYIQGVLWDD